MTAAPVSASRLATVSAPLLVTGDELLGAEELRLAAAAGTTVDVEDSVAGALRGWSSAGLVLLGADLAGAMAEARPGRRPAVHQLARSPAPDPVFRAAVVLGAEEVLELPTDAELLVDRLADAADGRSGHGRTLGVMAGSGGAGASTFACALALVVARMAPVLLVDLDPFGPGLDRVVGLDDSPGIRWDALASSSGRLGSRSLRSALPRVDALAVLTWPTVLCPPPAAASVREVLAAGVRGNRLVVVDLPAPVDALTLETAGRCDRLLLVVDPTVTGVAAAGRVVGRLDGLRDRLGLAVRSSANGVPAHQVAATLGCPVDAELPRQRRLAEHVDLGLGPVHGRRAPLARAARQVWRGLEGGAR
jgi:secretion/DNA translocation related CpaE-like protein